MHDLWTLDVPAPDKIARTVLVYLAIVILLRLAGKRELAQLNSLDLAVMLLLSNVVQNAIIGPDNSLLGGLIGAAVLVGLNAIVVRAGSLLADRYPRLTRWVEGTPTTLVRDGRVDMRAVRREGLRRGDVIAAARRQNADHIGDIEDMVLEPAGNLIVRLKPGEEPASAGDIAALRRELAAAQAALDRISARLDR